MVMFATPVYLDMFGVGGVRFGADNPQIIHFQVQVSFGRTRGRKKPLKNSESLNVISISLSTWQEEDLSFANPQTFGFQFSNIRHFLIEVQRC